MARHKSSLYERHLLRPPHTQELSETGVESFSLRVCWFTKVFRLSRRSLPDHLQSALGRLLVHFSRHCTGVERL